METNTLFHRQNRTPTEVSDEIDDSILNRSYDKAVRVANAEIAKRIAMATNSRPTAFVGQTKKSSKKGNSSNEDEAIEWKVGMPCRAIYLDDGEEYEASIVRIIDDRECIVRFIGYNNTEIVPISSLKPSLGGEERMKQVEDAVAEDPSTAGLPSEWTEVDPKDKPQRMDVHDRLASPVMSEKTPQPKKKAPKKKKSGHNALPELPSLPNLPTLNMSMLKNLGTSGMPMPPPPPPITLNSNRSDTEEQAISTMLLSWYMTGYYTGLYQGMKRERENH